MRLHQRGVPHVSHPASENVFLPWERDGRKTGWPCFELGEQQGKSLSHQSRLGFFKANWAPGPICLKPAGTLVSPEQQTICAVALADDGVPAEHQRRRTLLGPRQLAEDDPHHARLDHHPHDGLKQVCQVTPEPCSK